MTVEDYFQAAGLDAAVLRKHWDRIESRLEDQVGEVLEFLARDGVTATFFVFGWTAERQPQIVRRIAAAGHEIASHGYWPRKYATLVPDEFRTNLRRAKAVLEAAGANRIVGFRAPTWITDQDLWMLDVLAEEGYAYDSSINPVLRRFAGDPRRFRVHRHRPEAGGLSLWEFPISTVGLGGLRVAISGGNYIRQFPHTLLRHAVDWWDRTQDSPLVFYFLPWEFDREQPRIGSISSLSRIRHYRNLAKTRWVFRHHLERYRLQCIGDHLGIDWRQAPAAAEEAPYEVAAGVPAAPAAGPLEEVTLVVPVFNEKANIAYLQRTVLELRRRLAARYRIRLSVVDDGSTDGTWEELETRFAQVPDFRSHRHPQNRGIAAAILTGLRAAQTEVVCSIDCDCSYDPEVLGEMIPLLQGADVVTASPYHPQGQVWNVPAWRLLLSRSLSRIYSAILGLRLHTYTSCCRVYRRSVVEGLTLRHEDFLGVAEVLIRARLAGARVVEHPATLEARLFGESKMKTVRTIRRHLGLIAELLAARHRPPKETRPAGLPG